jgi:hypothetical protein
LLSTVSHCLSEKTACAAAPIPAPLPLRSGICPSIQVAPLSKEVRNPVGTIAWRAPVELLNR